MYRAPFFAVAALALAILAPSGPSHGADPSCSESEVRSQSANVNISAEYLRKLQRKCVRRNAARQLSADYNSRVLEVREIGRKRRSDLISQRHTLLAEATKVIIEKWDASLAERKRRFYTDLAGTVKKAQEAAKARDETRRVHFVEERRQTARVWRDDVRELKRGRGQEVRETLAEIRACYRRQLDETKEAAKLARRTLTARYREARQRIYSASVAEEDRASQDEQAERARQSGESYIYVPSGAPPKSSKSDASPPRRDTTLFPEVAGWIVRGTVKIAGSPGGKKAGEIVRDNLRKLPPGMYSQTRGEKNPSYIPPANDEFSESEPLPPETIEDSLALRRTITEIREWRLLREGANRAAMETGESSFAPAWQSCAEIIPYR